MVVSHFLEKYNFSNNCFETGPRCDGIAILFLILSITISVIGIIGVLGGNGVISVISTISTSIIHYFCKLY